jgi:hypothetical protein
MSMADLEERLLDALDHVVRVARNCARPTRRLYWIRARCQSAIDGDEAWREYDYPKMRGDDYKELCRMREALESIRANSAPTAISLSLENRIKAFYEIACNGLGVEP